MKERTKPIGIGITAILAVLLLTGSMFVSSVMAQPAQEVSDQQLEKQLQEITNEVQDALKEIENPNGVEPKLTVGEMGAAVCDGLNAALGILKWYIPYPMIDDAQDVLKDAADDFRNNNISSGMEKLGNALSMIWDIIWEYGPQLPVWLYNQLVDLLNQAQDFINQYS